MNMSQTNSAMKPRPPDFSARLFAVGFFLIYRLFVWPLILSVALLISPFHRKTAKAFQLRRERRSPKKLAGRPLWIHASSGEFEYAKPVIREFKKRHPQTPIVVTYSSPSYAEQVAKTPGIDEHLPLPFDLPGPCQDFIKKINPLALLVARTDFWPEVFSQVHAQKIPLLIFSCTFRELSGLRAILRPYYKFLFQFATSIYAVSKKDQSHLSQSGTDTPIEVAGDTRYDQVIYRLENAKALKENIFSNVKEPIFIMGSTWPQDEATVLPHLQKLLQNKKCKLMIAPHEPTPEHLKAIESQLSRLELSCQRYSTAQDFESHVLLIDQVGLLAELYLKADVAFVGGSFRSKVHSVMESLAAGLQTFVGPFHLNNREAIEFQSDELSNAVVAVKNGQELAAKLAERLQADSASNANTDAKSANESTRISNQTNSKKPIQNLVRSKAMTTARILNWIEKNIDPKTISKNNSHTEAST